MAVSSAEYTNVLAVTEARAGRLARISLEVVAAARELATRVGERAEAVLMGTNLEEQAQQLIQSGADMVYLAEEPSLAEYATEPYLAVLTDLVVAKRPQIVLFGATTMGEDLAPRLAQRLGTGLVCGCTRLDMDLSEWLLLATAPTHGDELMVTSSIPKGRPQIATLRPGAIEPFPPDPWRSGEVERMVLNLDKLVSKVRLLKRSGIPRPSLEGAKVVVSGGRGMGGPEGFILLEELARLLGGVVGASRGAVDEGWIGKEYWVGGAGGKVIKPDLYLACGISGALQHCLGIKDSKFIVAINNDPRAAIFSLANLGVVADIHEFLPALSEELKAS